MKNTPAIINDPLEILFRDMVINLLHPVLKIVKDTLHNLKGLERAHILNTDNIPLAIADRIAVVLINMNTVGGIHLTGTL